jgi:hypothetical protein
MTATDVRVAAAKHAGIDAPRHTASGERDQKNRCAYGMRI